MVDLSVSNGCRYPTRGRLALQALMAERGLSQAEVAHSVGVRQPTVSCWLTGVSRPDAVLRDAIEAVFGIPPQLWRTDAEQTLIDSLRGNGPAGA